MIFTHSQVWLTAWIALSACTCRQWSLFIQVLIKEVYNNGNLSFGDKAGGMIAFQAGIWGVMTMIAHITDLLK